MWAVRIQKDIDNVLKTLTRVHNCSEPHLLGRIYEESKEGSKNIKVKKYELLLVSEEVGGKGVMECCMH